MWAYSQEESSRNPEHHLAEPLGSGEPSLRTPVLRHSTAKNVASLSFDHKCFLDSSFNEPKDNLRCRYEWPARETGVCAVEANKAALDRLLMRVSGTYMGLLAVSDHRSGLKKVRTASCR